MGWVLKLAGVVAISVMILGCNQINFGLGQQKDEFAAPNPDIGTNPDDQKKQEDPIPDPDLPPVDEPPPPPPALVYTNGNCADQETVLSCLKCDAPDVPPPHPPALSKAKKLAKIE